MWSPVPRPKVIRRPLETYNHQRPKIKKRRNPLEFKPENHRGDRYFGIRHSDITDYLEKIVPSHAFSPSNIIAGPATDHGKGRHGEQVRPSTAPAAIPWFGRQSTDVSNWLRQLPPAHLGLDPDNKPLPHFPTKSSIVTDNRWQTRDFPPIPNVLWHYWSERPSSAPLATAPHQVQFQTILDAIKKSKPKSKIPPLATDPVQPGSATATPRSERSTPRSRAETPRVPTSGGNRPETPRSAENDKGPDPSRASSAVGGKHPGSSRPGTPLGSASEAKSPEARIQFCQCLKRQPIGVGSTHSCHYGRLDPNGSNLAKICNSCGKALDPTTSSQQPSPRSSKRPDTAQSADKAGNNASIELACGSTTSTPRSAMGTPRPQTPKVGEKPASSASSKRPPTCPTKPRRGASPSVGPRHAPVPFHEVIWNSRKAPEVQDFSTWKENGNGKEATADEFRLMSPDTFATKAVWQDSYQKHNKGNPFAIRAY